MKTIYSSWVRAIGLVTGAGLLASAGAQAQASLAGTADLAQVAGLPAAADLVVAGYAPTAADPYQHLPVWQAAFAYAGQASLAYQATNLPAGRYVVYSFLDANRNGLYEPTEKLARIPGTVALSGATTGATINYPEDCAFYIPGWTALDYFTKNPKPNFNPASTLPYLTSFSWGESDAIQLELGANWRYAVSVSTFMGAGYPGNRPLVAAIAAQPGRYKVQNAVTLGNEYREPLVMARYKSAYLYDSVTNTRSSGISPAAPDSLFKAFGQGWADDFTAIRAVYPGFKIDYLLNGGESGLELSTSGVAENGPGPWVNDPVVVRDKRAWDARFGPNDTQWYWYSSDRKAQQEAWLTNAAKAGIAAAQGFAPSMTYYGAGYNPAMGRWWGCHWYDFAYSAFLQYNAVDYSSVEFYYGARGNSFAEITANNKPNDLMTQAVNTYAGELPYPQKITKPYMSCGWISDDNNSVSAPDRWMGFLKFEALCGGVSPTVSNFDKWEDTKPQRLDGAVVANDVHMQWIWQYFVSSHAHAAFTHLQDYVTGGALVANTSNHPFDGDIHYPTPHPWYMFVPVGENNPTNSFQAVVAARKLNNQDKYLVLAWASSGADRFVNVAIPGLGTLALYARTAGTMYQIEGTGAGRTLEVLDPGAMNPAADLGPTPGVSGPLATTNAMVSADQALRAYPNPSAGSTTLHYYLATAGAVQLEVRDVLGRTVARPVAGSQAVGWHEVPLALPAAANGLYQAVLTSPAGRQTAKVLLQR